MKKLLLFLALTIGYFSYSQVGIGNTYPNSSSQLDVEAQDKGLLIPRLALKSTTDSSTIVNGNVNSLLVFNTATTTDLIPGYYYWYVDKWLRILNTNDVNGTGDFPDNIVIYNPLEETFNYIDNEGNLQNISFEDIVKANETVTVLKDNGDGTYTHTSEDDTKTTFKVTQSGTGNPNNNNTTGDAGDIYVDESTGDVYTHNGTTWVQVAGDNLIIDEGDPNDNNTSGNEGDVYIDNSTGDTYVYNETTGEWEQNTDVLNVANGKVTHTAVDGTVETFDVSQSGTGNPNNNNTTGDAGDIYVDESTGDVYTHNGTTWVQVAGDNLIIDEGDPNDNNTSGNDGDVYIDNSTGNTYVYNETTGEWEQSTDSLSVVDGKATHTAVDGTVETFDVSQSGTGNPNNNNTTGDAGDIYVDESTGDVYTFVNDPDGDPTTDDAAWVQSNVGDDESQTILVSTTDKSELYYVSEAYLAANNQTAPTSTDADGWDPASLPAGIYAIDIAGGVVNNFENIVNSGPVTINGDTYTTVEEYLENIVSANESQTILVSTTDKSELYYVSEAYLAANNQTAPTSTDADGWDPASLPTGIYAIDIAGGVVNNFENIVNSGPVTINGDTYTTVEEYLENIVSANESQTILVSTTDKSELYYVSEAYLAANNQTAPTSTDADGWDPASLPTGIYAIDIAGGVVNNFENIVNSGPVTINGDTYTTVEEYLENIVSANESQTILVSTTDKSELYYVSEAYLAANNQTAPTSTDADGWDPASLPTGIYAIDIAGGVVNNFENIVNSGPVTINGETFTTIEDYLESKEPWNVENTSTPAISNTENIYQKGKIGIGDFSGETTTESLDIKTGSARIREVNTNVGTIEAATTGQKDRVLVADANGIIKSLKATLPKFFFMPSVLIPVIAEQVPAGDTFGTIDLHAKYIDQFGTPQASSDTSLDVAIPVLPADELAYHITWYDEEVFENVAVSAAGVLTYDVKAGADIYEGSFMNIVFVVKED